MAKTETAAKDEPVKVTVMGVTVAVSPDVFDDIDMVEDIGAVQDGDIFAIPRVLKRAFGDDYRRVKHELADKNGVTTATRITEFFAKAMAAVNAVKAKN